MLAGECRGSSRKALLFYYVAINEHLRHGGDLYAGGVKMHSWMMNVVRS